MTAQDILKVAVSQIGIKEVPAGSNNVKYNTDYYGTAVRGSAYPWCCAFIWWVFKTAGASSLFCGGQKTAYCPTVETFYKRSGQWHSNPIPGDLVLFDFSGRGIAGHIGIVESVNPDGTITTIEGNTSVSSNDNGGAVMRRTRKMSVIRGFARPAYINTSTAEIKPTSSNLSSQGGNTVNIELNVLRKGSVGEQVKTLQRLLISLGYSCGSYGADGDFGSSTLQAVVNFQRNKLLSPDGIVGAKTWIALLKKS